VYHFSTPAIRRPYIASPTHSPTQNAGLAGASQVRLPVSDVATQPPEPEPEPAPEPMSPEPAAGGSAEPAAGGVGAAASFFLPQAPASSAETRMAITNDVFFIGLVLSSSDLVLVGSDTSPPALPAENLCCCRTRASTSRRQPPARAPRSVTSARRAWAHRASAHPSSARRTPRHRSRHPR